ncbi:MAG: family 2A encapsulin nanocompartment cargo protein cysteine desulfurase [Steroidobacteraceae bacterium]
MTTRTADPVPAAPHTADLPDAEWLLRLANEMFRRLPGDAPATVVAAPAAPAAAGAHATPAAAATYGAPALPGRGTAVPDRPAGWGNPARLGPLPPPLPPLGLPDFAPAPGGPVAEIASPEFYFLRAGTPSAPIPGPFADPHPPFDVHAIRRDFPVLAEKIHGRPLVWFDNGATTQKPQAVIDRLAHFYAHENSNIHRGAHTLAARATDAYEAARERVAKFIGAGSPDEIVFVRGATEGINLVAKTWGAQHLGPGDEIVVSHLEHHANIVPWQQIAQATGARLRVAPVDDRGEFLLEEYARLLTPRTRLVAVTHVSNALGTVTPVKQIVELAHRAGARVLVDGAQSVSHMPVDVQTIDSDFFVFSGHKVFGPTGIGAVHAKREVSADMPPWQGGGNMISDVTFERTIYQPPPARFEAGTGNIADAVGLGAALEYLQRIGMANIAAYEQDLLAYATACLERVPGLRIIGRAPEKAAVLSFVLDGHAPEDVGTALDRAGIAVRAGHHCAQPILRRYGLESTVRASFAFYNTREEIQALQRSLLEIAATRS